jgi:LmbE family N-acetylglucosaminyl deacetylase
MKDFYAMVIAAHPDDPEFGIAGTVVKWTQEGKQVVYVICTNGNKGTDDPNMAPDKLAKLREQEQTAAAKVAGVNDIVFLKHEDQGLEDTPEFRKEIVRAIRTYKPQVVASSDPYRKYIWHRDHRICGQVVLDAVFPYARDRLAYPDLIEAGLMPHKVREVLMWGSDDPDYVSDITGTYDIKMAALRCHKSQVGGHPPEWEKFIRTRYETAGKSKGYALGEAFHKVEILW